MSDGHGLSRTTGPTALDRSPQLLPVPLGGLTPARRHPSTMLRAWRRHQTRAVTVAALVAGMFGVWLATGPQTSTVAFDTRGVHVDGALLTAVVPQTVPGVHVYGGPASLAITVPQRGTSRAGAVMIWGGLATTGQCALVATRAGALEACHFTVGSTRMSAVDSFDPQGHRWHRRYADGVEVTIVVPAGSTLIPIPFPLGH